MKGISGIKETDSKRNTRKKQKNRGIITVFVTLIMVPVVAINGIMVDVARLKLYSSQAVMAADSYGDAVLSEFDNLLKQLYGLFSITQNEAGLEAIEELAKYVSYSFDPNGDDKGFNGFMPYQDVKLQVVYEKVEGASLSNPNVLMTQISDFMKYRIVEEIMNGEGILSCLEQFDTFSPDMEVMDERSKITDSSAEALGAIDEYYQELKKLTEYPSYLERRQRAFETYSQEMTKIVNDESYEDYVYYLEHQAEIDAIISEFEDITVETDENLVEMTEIYERFSDFDVDECVEKWAEKLSDCSQISHNHNNDPISFYNTSSIIDTLGSKTEELESILQQLDEQISQLKAQLIECSEEIQEKIQEEIQQLDDILKIADDFRETYELIAVVNENKKLNQQNQEQMETEVPALDQVKDEILQGKAEPRKSDWHKSIRLIWYDFRDDKGSFYAQLQKLCESENNGKGDKDAGEKEVQKADTVRKNAEDKLKGDEVTTARDISSELASQLKTSGVLQQEVPDITDYFSGGMSFEALSRAGSNLLDKFLVTSYDFGMFSSRVSGINPEDQTDGSYMDYSLTEIKMSPDVNYLYGAELEYLFGGHNKSVSNLNETRNIICGVRLTMNFASTYIIDEINHAINAIADAAAGAVAASGIGAAAAPLVKVAVSGALRMAVATMEMAADWENLKNREKVVFLKRELGDLTAIDDLADFLGVDLEGDLSKTDLELSYEDYLYVLLVLLVDDNTLMSRTSNLITLNVNQAMNDGDLLTNLDFNMSNTVTAIKSTCKIRADFVVLPENIARMYYSNTRIEALIEVLEDRYFGYSVIRGY